MLQIDRNFLKLKKLNIFLNGYQCYQNVIYATGNLLSCSAIYLKYCKRY